MEEVKDLKDVFKKFGFSVDDEDFTEDRKTMLCSATDGKITFDIVCLLQDEKYWAYDLSSNCLPRELYSDSVKEGFTVAQRSSEIVSTVRQLLSKKVAFHPAPGIFNKERGYVWLHIDGVSIKIFLKKNGFKLPLRI